MSLRSKALPIKEHVEKLRERPSPFCLVRIQSSPLVIANSEEYPERIDKRGFYPVELANLQDWENYLLDLLNRKEALKQFHKMTLIIVCESGLLQYDMFCQFHRFTMLNFPLDPGQCFPRMISESQIILQCSRLVKYMYFDESVCTG